jgi:hypothetical protein
MMKHKKMPSHSSFRGSYKSHFMASIYFLGLIHQHGMGGMARSKDFLKSLGTFDEFLHRRQGNFDTSPKTKDMK